MKKKYLTLKRIAQFVLAFCIGTVLSILYVDINPGLYSGPPLYGPGGSSVDITWNVVFIGILVVVYICIIMAIALHYWNWKQDQKAAERRKLELENFY